MEHQNHPIFTLNACQVIYVYNTYLIHFHNNKDSCPFPNNLFNCTLCLVILIVIVLSSHNFVDFVTLNFQGITELTPSIRHWVYLATTVAEVSAPIFEYGSIVLGILILVGVFIKTYKNVVFTKEALEKGKETLRRGSSFIINGQHRLLIIRDSYSLLNNVNTDPDPDLDSNEDDGV